MAIILLFFLIRFARVFPCAVCAKSLQSCLTLCNPMDYSQPSSSVHGIFQAGIPEWVAISSSRESVSLAILFLYNFIYLFISDGAGLRCCESFALVVESGGNPLVACGEQASSHCGSFSLCAKALSHSGFSICGSRLQGASSIVVTHGLSCYKAYGIFLDQGSKPSLLH